MKTEEDEAFDDLARRQGMWGGGFQAKRAMAADKLQEPVARLTNEELTKLMTDSYDQGVKDALETIVQLIKELRPAIRASEVMGKGKPTEEWFDILAGAIKEKNG